MATSDPVIPCHLAIIMDGNGRWARRKGLARYHGHNEGAESVRVVARECVRAGVEQLTLYAFSSENWRRPRTEVQFLMGLLDRFLVSEREEIMRNNIRLKAIGRLDAMPAHVRRALAQTVEMSRSNTGLILRLALNYGGRQEIVDAARKLLAAAAGNGLDPASITDADLGRFMYDEEMTEPDLLVRTGGEMRLSNFLLWHISYTELYFTTVCWPEFREKELRQAFEAFPRRERRFGGLVSKKHAAPSSSAAPSR